MRRTCYPRSCAPIAACLAMAATLMLLASSADAAVRTWFSAVSGSASTASLWSPNGVPVAGDIASFTQPGSYTVSWASPQDTLSYLDVVVSATVPSAESWLGSSSARAAPPGACTYRTDWFCRPSLRR